MEAWLCSFYHPLYHAINISKVVGRCLLLAGYLSNTTIVYIDVKLLWMLNLYEMRTRCEIQNQEFGKPWQLLIECMTACSNISYSREAMTIVCLCLKTFYYSKLCALMFVQWRPFYFCYSFSQEAITYLEWMGSIKHQNSCMCVIYGEVQW